VTSARREQLLDLAADLIERDGIDGFGTGTLARAAGIKPPSLYKHFEGLADIENALISREFAAFAREMTDAAAAASDDPRGRLTAFAAAYRRQALARPQLYRLMTARPLDRAAIEPGSEDAAMAPLVALFREDAAHHDVARAAWAWAHGLVILEIAERFPPGADLDASWEVLVDMLAARAGQAAPGRRDPRRAAPTGDAS
jgi:AcrR family transcriptional regulator